MKHISKKMDIDFKLMIIAFITSSIGAIVRILHENEKASIKKSKVLLIYFCSLSIGYMCYELVIIYEHKNWIGFLSIIGGIISIDLVNLMIEKLPTYIMNKFSKNIDKDGDFS